MQNNTVKELIQKLGEDYWFEIWTDNSEEPIVDGRDCYNAFDDYYDTEIKKVVIDHPNDEELQVIKLYIEQKVQPEPEIQAEPIKLKEVKTMKRCHIYTDENGIEYCEHTNKPLMDAEPEKFKGLIYYDNDSKCPHCKNQIKVISY